MKEFITGGTCADRTPLFAINPALCDPKQCPPASDIAPCTCAVSTLSPVYLSLTCVDTNRTDDAIQSFITSGNVSAIAAFVDTVDFTNNSLSQAPTGLISTFPAVVSVTLAGNKITSLADGVLNAMQNVVLIDVSRNEISAIAVGALPPAGENKLIHFSIRLLKSDDSAISYLI